MKAKTVMGLVAASAAAALLAAGQAHADDQNGYMTFLENHGISRESISEEELVTLGEDECRKMRAGTSEQDLAYALEAYKSNAESTDVVVAAHLYLCPDAPVAHTKLFHNR